MLNPTGWWLLQEPVDLRCGMDRLLVAVQDTLGRQSCDGGAYVLTSFAVEKRFAIAVAPGSRCCAPMRRVCG